MESPFENCNTVTLKQRMQSCTSLEKLNGFYLNPTIASKDTATVLQCYSSFLCFYVVENISIFIYILIYINIELIFRFNNHVFKL